MRKLKGEQWKSALKSYTYLETFEKAVLIDLRQIETSEMLPIDAADDLEIAHHKE